MIPRSGSDCTAIATPDGRVRVERWLLSICLASLSENSVLHPHLTSPAHAGEGRRRARHRVRAAARARGTRVCRAKEMRRWFGALSTREIRVPVIVLSTAPSREVFHSRRRRGRRRGDLRAVQSAPVLVLSRFFMLGGLLSPRSQLNHGRSRSITPQRIG